MNEAKRKFQEKGTISKRVSFPVLFWEEWAKDCKENYNDVYYLKIQSDHQYKKDMQVFIDSIIIDMLSLKSEVLSLRAEVEELRNTPAELEPKKIKTLGGN